jgi:sugar/nucleoside kinase (ribokinase family)
MNTDVVITGLHHFPATGELVNGKSVFIGPGGKSRNIAAMAAILMPKQNVAMESKTSQDKYGLWKEPLSALKEAGMDTRFIQILVKDGLLICPVLQSFLLTSKAITRLLAPRA